MVELDQSIIRVLLAATSHSPAFTWAMHKLLDLDLLRMGPVVAMLLYVWVSPQGRVQLRAEQAARTIIGILVATLASQVLQGLLPERPRPLHALPGFGFPPLPEASFDWSSFPSDTATLSFAMVAGIWAVSRLLGLAAALWALLVICFPRLFFGLHYPSDILAGALLGLAAVMAALRLPALQIPALWFRLAAERHPAGVLVLLSLLCADFITSLSTPRMLLHAARDLMHAVSG